MKRRNFLAGLVGTTVAWPLTALAQQPAMPVIGFLNSASPQPFENYVAGFRAGLKETGYVDGKNVAIEFRWAEGHYDRLPGMAARSGAPQGGGAGRDWRGVGRPSRQGSHDDRSSCLYHRRRPGQTWLRHEVLSRPGGNMTGVSLLVTQMETKRLGLLHALVPKAELIGILLNPNNPVATDEMREVQEAARAFGQQIHILPASSESEINAAFATVVQLHAAAMLVCADPFFNSQRDKIIALAARHAIPAIYEQREHALAGGLMSYGTSFSDGYRQVGIYVGRILKGEKPADLPVQQSTKFEFVINLKTAKALGIEVPPNLSAEADEIIE